MIDLEKELWGLTLNTWLFKVIPATSGVGTLLFILWGAFRFIDDAQDTNELAVQNQAALTEIQTTLDIMKDQLGFIGDDLKSRVDYIEYRELVSQKEAGVRLTLEQVIRLCELRQILTPGVPCND